MFPWEEGGHWGSLPIQVVDGKVLVWMVTFRSGAYLYYPVAPWEDPTKTWMRDVQSVALDPAEWDVITILGLRQPSGWLYVPCEPLEDVGWQCE